MKKCNPFKIMLQDAWNGFIGPMLLIGIGTALLFLQVHIIFSCFISTKEIVTKYCTPYAGDPYPCEWTEIPTTFALWCRGICLLELTLLVAAIFYAWYASAKKRCR